MSERGGKRVQYKFRRNENVQKLMTLCEVYECVR